MDIDNEEVIQSSNLNNNISEDVLDEVSDNILDDNQDTKFNSNEYITTDNAEAADESFDNMVKNNLDTNKEIENISIAHTINSISETATLSTTYDAYVTNIQSQLNNHSITLTWNNPVDTDFSKVLIYRNNTLLGESTTEEFTENALYSNQKYNYTLVCVNSNGNSGSVQ